MMIHHIPPSYPVSWETTKIPGLRRVHTEDLYGNRTRVEFHAEGRGDQ